MLKSKKKFLHFTFTLGQSTAEDIQYFLEEHMEEFEIQPNQVLCGITGIYRIYIKLSF